MKYQGEKYTSIEGLELSERLKDAALEYIKIDGYFYMDDDKNINCSNSRTRVVWGNYACIGCVDCDDCQYCTDCKECHDCREITNSYKVYSVWSVWKK